MSYNDFLKAMELAPQCKFFRTAGGKSVEEINKAEELLGAKFSKQCREFYEKFGYLSFDGNEIFGVDCKESDVLEGNSVAYALNDRKEYNLKNEWIPFYNYGDGALAFFDYTTINADGEPRIILAEYTGDEYEMLEEVAEDFGVFLWDLVESSEKIQVEKTESVPVVEKRVVNESKLSYAEFKNKCKKEKTKTYKMKQISTVLALIGFAVVLVGFYINNSSAQFNIVPYVIGLPIAIVGAVLDVVCDKNMKKEYKAFILEK